MGHTITVMEGSLAICRRDPAAGMPDWFRTEPPFASLVITDGELTLIAPEAGVPDGEKADRGWRALRVEGPFELHAVGVISGLVAPLAAAEVSLLSVSTFDTDYLLIAEKNLERAAQALRDAGHEVRGL